LGKNAPEDIVDGVRQPQPRPQVRSRLMGILAERDKTEHHALRHPWDRPERLDELGWEEGSELVCEYGLAAKPPHAGVDHLGVRKELLADSRANAVSSDEHVSSRRCPVGEACTDGAIKLLLVVVAYPLLRVEIEKVEIQ
jgi:hypothetical protein